MKNKRPFRLKKKKQYCVHVLSTIFQEHLGVNEYLFFRGISVNFEGLPYLVFSTSLDKDAITFNFFPYDEVFVITQIYSDDSEG